MLFKDFALQWQDTYPAMVGMWRRSWPEFIPFLDFPPEIPVRERQTNRPNPTGTVHGWQAILNVLALTYGDRLGLS